MDRARIRFPDAVFPKKESSKEENAELFKDAESIIIYMDNDSFKQGKSDGTKMELKYAMNNEKLDNVYVNDEVLDDINLMNNLVRDVNEEDYTKLFVKEEQDHWREIFDRVVAKYGTVEAAAKALDVDPDAPDVEEDIVDHAQILDKDVDNQE